MAYDPSSKAAATARRLSWAAAAWCVLVGASTLLGRLIGGGRFETSFPFIGALSPNLAGAFMFLGAGLGLLRARPVPWARRAGEACAVAAALIGLASLAEEAFGPRLGLEGLLMRLPSAVSGRPPGRMEPLSALSCVLSGLSLLGLRRGGRSADLPAAAAFSIAFVSALGYTYGSTLSFELTRYARLSAQDEVTFLALGAGLLCANMERGVLRAFALDTSGSLLARGLLPAIGIVPVLGWIELAGSRAGLYGRSFGLAAFVLCVIAALAGLAFGAWRGLAQADQRRHTDERELRRLAMIVDSCQDPIVSVGLDGVIVTWNPSAERLFGYEAEEAVGRSMARLSPPEDENGLKELLARVARGERIDKLEKTCLTKDGRRIDVVGTLTPLRDGEGRIIGASCLARDVTDLKRVERLKVEIEERRHVDALKEQFLGVVSHELRTPIVVVQTALFNLREKYAGALNGGQARLVEMAYANAERLTRMVESLLDLSRLEAGKMEVNRVRLDLRALLRELVRGVPLAASKRNVTVELDLPRGLPEIEADPDLLSRVVGNLLDNAVRFARSRVSVKVREAGPPDAPGLRFSVVDDGAGIPAEAQGGLFNKFYQVSRPSGTRGYKGSGLGLAICREIVALHRGRIWVESQKGEGTSFHFVLPGNVEPPGHRPRLKILVVDDEQELLELLSMRFKSGDMAVETAMDGLSGIEKAKAFHPDVVVVDLVMPNMDGWEVCRRLHEDPQTRALPIVIITAARQPDCESLARSIGAKRVILKPFDNRRLLDAIREAAGNGGAAGCSPG